MAVLRLPSAVWTLRKLNELMKENCSVSLCPFDNDALFYQNKQTNNSPEVSMSSKVEAFGRLTPVNLSKCLTKNQEISLGKVCSREQGKLLKLKWDKNLSY